jgi:beta-glucosidase
VLVLTGGAALAVDWAQQRLPAILMSWYPGQRGGSAVADVLFGDANPAGRLPVTFYKESEKLPPFDDYSMRGRTYRYFNGAPLYPFGHGLSYTRFEYSGLTLDPASAGPRDAVQATLTVKNVGPRAGDEVVQLYVRPLSPQRPRAEQELRGVQRISLQPGESKRVSFTLEPGRDLRHYDDGARRYAVDAGDFEVRIGASSADIRQRQRLTVRTSSARQ